jgi:hypothetical protein
MQEELLDALIEKLNRHTLGVAKTPELRKMLRMFFSEKEARIALEMSPRPEPLDVLVQRTGIPLDSLVQLLETMSNKGLVYAGVRDQKRFYSLYPFFPGMVEINLMKGEATARERELSHTYDRYYEQGGGQQIFSAPTRYSRVIPVKKVVDDNRSIVPYEPGKAKLGRAGRKWKCNLKQASHLWNGQAAKLRVPLFSSISEWMEESHA